jgi:hypothetical protein
MLHHACLLSAVPVHSSPLAPRTSGWRCSAASVAAASERGKCESTAALNLAWDCAVANGFYRFENSTSEDMLQCRKLLKKQAGSVKNDPKSYSCAMALFNCTRGILDHLSFAEAI